MSGSDAYLLEGLQRVPVGCCWRRVSQQRQRRGSGVEQEEPSVFRAIGIGIGQMAEAGIAALPTVFVCGQRNILIELTAHDNKERERVLQLLFYEVEVLNQMSLRSRYCFS
jgi:hypothetical protein